MPFEVVLVSVIVKLERSVTVPLNVLVALVEPSAYEHVVLTVGLGAQSTTASSVAPDTVEPLTIT
jgi:hypothetical protein